MTCKWGEKKNMVVLLAVGLVLLIGGVVFNLVLPEDAHMLSRIAGFFSGMGSSFVAIALVVLLRRRLLGEARAKDSRAGCHGRARPTDRAEGAERAGAVRHFLHVRDARRRDGSRRHALHAAGCRAAPAQRGGQGHSGAHIRQTALTPGQNRPAVPCISPADSDILNVSQTAGGFLCLN